MFNSYKYYKRTACIVNSVALLFPLFCCSISCKCQGGTEMESSKHIETPSAQNDMPAETNMASFKLDKTPSSSYYEEVEEGIDIDWEEVIPVFHYWREIAAEEYLFVTPTEKQISYWKKQCEKENGVDSAWRRGVQGYCVNMNHFMTIQDLLSVWARQKSYGGDLDFIMWRLQQYDTDSHSIGSEYERFMILRQIINRLCNYSPGSQIEENLKAGMETTLEEFYCRMIFREAMHHSSSNLANLLKKENLAWESYHTQLDSTYRILDAENRMGSAYPMAICGIMKADADIRKLSLEDFYFALTNCIDYDIPCHSVISIDKVIKEYKGFIRALKENEEENSHHFQTRRKALEAEMDAWNRWVESRNAISSQLKGLVKDAYDNSTNNVLRAKFIMLKNRYQGYGINSGDVDDCLVQLDASDAEIDGPSFDVRWEQKYREPWRF